MILMNANKICNPDAPVLGTKCKPNPNAMIK